MRKRKAQASVTIGAVMFVTVLFVINVLAAPSNLASDARNATQSLVPLEDMQEITTMPETTEVQSDPLISETGVIEYAPDVSGIEETYISDEAYFSCIRYGEKYNIAPELLMAMIERESEGNPDAFNGTDSGLMQVAQKWHYGRMERLGITDLFDTDQNIHIGADYLAELFDKYEDVSFVLMIYNMGYETANKYYSQGVISKYAQGITARADELSLLHTYGGVRE